MMIDIFCAGDCSNEGKPIQKGGCGVILVHSDKFKRVQHREFSYGLGSSWLDLAEVQAVRLALASIAPAFRGDKVTINTNSIVVATALTGEDGEKEPILKSMPAAAELIKWYHFFKDIEVIVSAGRSRHLDRALELARKGLEAQTIYDSLTLPGDVNVSPTRS